MRLAVNEYVLLMDDDVLLEPEILIRLTAFATCTTHPTLVGGQMLNLLHPAHLHISAEYAEPEMLRVGRAVPGALKEAYLLGHDDRRTLTEVAIDVRAPVRDTRDVLAHYVPAFDPSFLGLYGDEKATSEVAKEFKIIYQKVPGAAPGSYTMDHSAGSYVYDPQGRLRLYVANGQGADVFAHDEQLAVERADARRGEGPPADGGRAIGLRPHR